MRERKMDRTTERLCGLTFLLSCFAMSVWVLAAMPVNDAVNAISAPVLPAAVYLCVVYLTDSVLTERGSRVDLMVVLNVFCTVGGALGYRYLTEIDPAMPAVRTTFAAVYAICVIAAWYAAAFPVKASTVIGCFDWMAVLLVLHLVLRQLGMALLFVKTPGICAASMACSLITMIRIRLERTGASGATVGNAAAGGILLGGIIAAIVLLAVLMTAALSGTLHGLSTLLLAALTAVGGVLSAAAGLLFHLAELFVKWLSSWIQTDPELGEAESISSVTYDSDASAAADGHMPQWASVLLAAAVIVLIVWFFRRIRGIRTEGHTGSAAAPKEKRHGSLWELFSVWGCLLRERIGFALKYRRNIATPAGMLIWCERRYRRVCPRRSPESGGAYLRRLAAYLEEERAVGGAGAPAAADGAGAPAAADGAGAAAAADGAGAPTAAGGAGAPAAAGGAGAAAAAADKDVCAALRELADLTELAFYAPPGHGAPDGRYPALLRRLRNST